MAEIYLALDTVIATSSANANLSKKIQELGDTQKQAPKETNRMKI